MPTPSPPPTMKTEESAKPSIFSSFAHKVRRMTSFRRISSADSVPQTSTIISPPFQPSRRPKRKGRAIESELPPFSETCGHCSTRKYMNSSEHNGSREKLDWESMIIKKASSHGEISAIDGMCERCLTWYMSKLDDDELQSGQVEVKDDPREESSRHQGRVGPEHSSRVTQRISPSVLNMTQVKVENSSQAQ